MRWSSGGWALAWLGLGAVGVALARPALVARHAAVHERDDVVALPGPERTVVLSLGYRAALADILYASTLVQSGLRLQERRGFEHVADYLETIVTLDPSYRAPYRYADTLITFQAKPVSDEQRRRARALLLRGLEQFPYDQELWNSTGQFLAYVGVRWLASSAEQEAWRREGAKILARACELVGSNENIPYHCVSAARLLSDVGEADAARRFVERLLAVSDDEEVRQLALGYLQVVQGTTALAESERRTAAFNEAWRQDLRFISKDLLLILGPSFDPARCAGSVEEGCAATWLEWSERQDRRER